MRPGGEAVGIGPIFDGGPSDEHVGEGRNKVKGDKLRTAASQVG